MKVVFVSAAAVTAALAFTVGTAIGSRVPPGTISLRPVAAHPLPHVGARASTRRISPAALNGVIQQYCGECHNDNLLTGNLSLDKFDVEKAYASDSTAERMIRKLRAQMMPPPGQPRPSPDTLLALVQTIEENVDHAAQPNPGTRTFQRLNRAEYEAAVRDLLAVDVDAGDYLPLDTKSANFDNIADVQSISATLLESYLNAAAAVSRLAIGDRKAAALATTYPVSPFASQYPWDHVEGAPYGTRGGVVTDHSFPADGMYSFRVNVEGGVGTKLQDIDISIDGERVALLHYEKGVEPSAASADEPLGADFIRTEPIFVKAGQHHVSSAFVRQMDGPYEDLIKPHDWSEAGKGTASTGTTTPPHVLDLTIIGPQKTTGISETPSRRIILSCRPSKTLSDKACAEQIITRLGTKAYRRPLTQQDKEGLLAFYTKAAAAGGFEDGVQAALQAMLASPRFEFRFERQPENAQPGSDYQLDDYDLASRLSFFLWGSLPDDELLAQAKAHKLSDQKVLDREMKRMLADPRSEALATRFASQWLRLQDLDKVRPDAFWFPDYNQQLADAMRTETELFFNDIVKNDHSILDLFTANYTFVNERLARHYGIPNISGREFRRVEYPDGNRRGILGQGAILVQTSLANRTSPVLRGKWVMEVLLGSPPPPPPPNVPTLDETADAKDGHPLTTRERVELHRKNPVCASCHKFMDPIGLALDNFDVTGRWRYRENGMLLDTQGILYDGTPISTLPQLVDALLKRPIPLVRMFTENLMAYAVGRRMEDFDQPTIRAISKQASENGYKFSDFVAGVVNSSAFRSKRVEPVAATQDHQ